MVYVFMQTFAIPGTVSLSLLSGALFGIVRGLLLVAGCHSAFCSFFLVVLSLIECALVDWCCVCRGPIAAMTGCAFVLTHAAAVL